MRTFCFSCVCVCLEKKMRMNVAKMKKSGGCVDSESWEG